MRRTRVKARVAARAAGFASVVVFAALVPGLSIAVDEPGQHIYRGNFAIGKAGALFSSCFSGTRIAVEDATANGALGAAYRDIASQAGKAIFVEFSGRESGGRLRAENLHRASAGGPGCAERIAELGLVALGSDPVWGLETRASGMRLRILREFAPREFPPARRAASDGVLRYEASTAHSVLRIAVRPGACRDALSGSLFDHLIEVRVDDQVLEGCAYWGDLDRPGH